MCYIIFYAAICSFCNIIDYLLEYGNKMIWSVVYYRVSHHVLVECIYWFIVIFIICCQTRCRSDIHTECCSIPKLETITNGESEEGYKPFSTLAQSGLLTTSLHARPFASDTPFSVGGGVLTLPHNPY